MSETIPVGKLPATLLRRMLARGARGARGDAGVRLGPGIGRDAAVVEVRAGGLVAASDPVTFASDEIGWYAVHVNANDVACCGGRPRWFLATVLLPERATTDALAERVFEQIENACAFLGAVVVGGHTEVTEGLDRVLIAGTMLGELVGGTHVDPREAAPGDVLLLTKGIALEGATILARERRDALVGAIDGATLARCEGWLHDPGISVVGDALAALAAGGVHALHDPTEGGLATALAELAEASGAGLTVDEAALPLLPECAAICEALGLDPLGLIASGALLLAVSPERAADVEAALAKEGLAVARIGALETRSGCRLRRSDGAEQPLPSFGRDELARALEGAS